MIDEGLIAPYLASSLVNLLITENKILFRIIKDLNSTKMNDFLRNGGIPVTLFGNMLTFRDSNKPFKLDGDLLESMTNYDFNVSLFIPKHQKLIYEFGKAKNFTIKQKGRKSDKTISLIKLLKSKAIMASVISTIFIPSDSDEFCDSLIFLLKVKQAGNNSDIINKEIVVILH